MLRWLKIFFGDERSGEASQRLPSIGDFGAGRSGDLDANDAWTNFGGLTRAQAKEKLKSAPEVYSGDFTWMGEKAFSFYFPAIDELILESLHEGDGSSFEELIFWLVLPFRTQFGPSRLSSLEKQKPRALELCHLILQGIETWSEDFQDAEESKEEWEKTLKILCKKG